MEDVWNDCRSFDDASAKNIIQKSRAKLQTVRIRTVWNWKCMPPPCWHSSSPWLAASKVSFPKGFSFLSGFALVLLAVLLALLLAGVMGQGSQGSEIENGFGS